MTLTRCSRVLAKRESDRGRAQGSFRNTGPGERPYVSAESYPDAPNSRIGEPVGVDVAEPALPATTNAATNTEASTAAMRLMFLPLP
jgi:hypothetical protein